MTPFTASKLNIINKEFYDKIGTEFDSSRYYFWPGWQNLWTKIEPDLKSKDSLKILDLGCGNARFYDFVSEKLYPEKFDYYGLDFSQNLLQIAKNKHLQTNCKLFESDILDFKNNIKLPSQITIGEFDLIVLFGVMHHIGDSQKRMQFFSQIENALSYGGIFVFTTWQFLSTPRMASKVVDPKSLDGSKIFHDLGLNPQELSENDYILDWNKGQSAYRYGHIYSDLELNQLTTKAKLTIKDSFEADGREANLNRYYITKSQAN